MLKLEDRPDIQKRFLVIEGRLFPHEEKMIIKNRIDNLAELYIVEEDGNSKAYYDITGLKSLTVYFSQPEVDKIMVMEVYKSIIQLQDIAREYLLDISAFVLDLDYIFLSSDKKCLQFIYGVDRSNGYDPSLERLTQQLSDLAVNGDEDVLEFFYRLKLMIDEERMTIEGLRKLINAEEEVENSHIISSDSYESTLKDSLLMETETSRHGYALIQSWILLIFFEALTAGGAFLGFLTIIRSTEEILYKKALGGLLLLLILICQIVFFRFIYRKQRFDVTTRESIFEKRALKKDGIRGTAIEHKVTENTENTEDTEDTEDAVITLSREYHTDYARNNGHRGRPYLVSQDKIKIPILKTPFVIGKEKGEVDCYINNPMVSRYHGIIDFENNEYCIIDMNSTNGTFLDDRKMISNSLYHLHNGSRISFADECYQFKLL